MSHAVGRVLAMHPHEYRTHGEILLVEAETGIGKTLAYLVPALLSGKRIVISTATINLQDQIIKKEIPLLEKAFGEELPVVCIKGRQNYLCHYRWYQYRSTRQAALFQDEICGKIDEWLEETATGDRAELSWLRDSSPVWPRISAQSHQCLGGDCPESSLCFMNDLRKRAGAARLIVVNHHLFFSDLALRKSGYGEVLPRYEAVIFDEAHHLENVASTFFGKTFSHYKIVDLVNDIENQAETDLPLSNADRIITSARGIKQRAETFSQFFPGEIGRYPLHDFVEDNDEWYDEVKSLSSGLERLAEQLKDFKGYGEGWKSLVKRVEELQDALVEIALPEVMMNEGRHVHWYERRERTVTLSATPISIANTLRDFLYPHVDGCIMTSATLTTGGDFTYVCQRLGLDEETETLQFRSPFDYAGRSLLYVPDSSFPLPTEADYIDRVCRQTLEIVKLSQGRALVLCTSFRGMDTLADYLQENQPYQVLVQGTASRHSLLQRFIKEKETILVAVASFWEGVDVPGDSLRCVVIDKLPFEVPSDPVLQARISDIRERGGNPFFDFQVPRAILSLRQGVGRLMRTSRDSGVIAILDGRLYKKGYGKMFRASLPNSPVTRSLDEVSQFFKKDHE